ncbi:MAG: SRPBCC family protein [Burkholderiaceae bacterium]
MSWLFSLLRWLVIALCVLAAVSFFFPANQVVERSLVVEHSPDRVWELLEDPPAWNRWSPWYERDPDMKITYTGAPKGMGARWSWESSREGSGTISIIGASVPRQLDYIIQFSGMGDALGQFILEPVNSGTNLTWRLQIEAGFNPLMRWFGLFLDSFLGDDFNHGLANIAKVLNKQAT